MARVRSGRETSVNSAVEKLPPVAPGLKIGLFGGSFDPPHDGHRAASLFALRRLGLDRIWWLVSPGNPLKDTHHLPPLAARVEAARRIARAPQIEVTGIEARIGTNFTFETVAWLRQRCPRVHFVWIMGADNLATFNHWRCWRNIVASVPIAVIDRPGWTWSAMHSPAGALLSRYRYDEINCSSFATATPPAFVFLHGPRSALSSTALRAEAAAAKTRERPRK
jgi:nicotinate-nucleotide adenylyltransferase